MRIASDLPSSCCQDGQGKKSPPLSPLLVLLRMACLAVGAIRHLGRAVPPPPDFGALFHGTMLRTHLGLAGLHHAVVYWGVGVEPLGRLLGSGGQAPLSFLPTRCAISLGDASYLPVSGASTLPGSLAFTALRLAAALASTSPRGMWLSRSISCCSDIYHIPN